MLYNLLVHIISEHLNLDQIKMGWIGNNSVGKTNSDREKI